MSVQLASGMGENMVRHLWVHALSNAQELARLGWQVLPGQPYFQSEEIDVPGRLMSFLLHFMEARWWSCAWQRFALPEAFAGILHPTESQSIMEELRGLHQAAVDVQCGLHAGIDLGPAITQALPRARELLEQVYWLSWPAVDTLLRFLAHHHWAPHPDVICLLRRLFTRIGDTKCVEESHKIGRGMEKRDQQPDVLDLLAFFSRLQGPSTPLCHRGIPHLCPADSHVYSGAAKPPVPWAKMFARSGFAQLPKELSELLPKLWDGKFTSRTPQSGRPSIMACRALVHLHATGQWPLVTRMWHAVALRPHTLVRHRHPMPVGVEQILILGNCRLSCEVGVCFLFFGGGI